jgi:hypothetical protein
MKSFADIYRLKDGYEKPTQYLGAEVKGWRLPDDAEHICWALCSSQYVKEAIRNIEVHLQSQDCALKKSHQPFPSNYCPKLDPYY